MATRADPLAGCRQREPALHRPKCRGLPKGALSDFTKVGFSAPDARTVRISLEHPASYFLSLLQHWVWWPVHLPTLHKSGDPYVRGNPWARPDTFVGNGPFTLKEWRTGQHIEVVKSLTYWDRSIVKWKAIRFLPIEDLNAEERALLAESEKAVRSVADVLDRMNATA